MVCGEASSNWILITFGGRELLYLIMQAVPPDFLSGELSSAAHARLCEFMTSSRKHSSVW